MKGSIRFFLGLLITAGAVGTFDVNPDASVIKQSLLAAIGLSLMYWGSEAIRKQQQEKK